MKKYQLINFYHLIGLVDICKLSRELRTQLIALDLAIGKIVTEHNDEIEAIKKRLSKGHEREIQEMAELQSALAAAPSIDDRKKIENQIAQCTIYADLENQLNEQINIRLMADVAVNVQPIATDDFITMCADNDIKITLELLRGFQLASLLK